MHRTDFDDLDFDKPAQHAANSTDVPPTPPLTSEAQSPQTSSLPSANASTIDEPVHTSLPQKGFPVLINGLTLENAEINS